MITPTVTELHRPLEPVEKDPFIDTLTPGPDGDPRQLKRRTFSDPPAPTKTIHP